MNRWRRAACPAALNSGANFGSTYVSRKIVTAVASTIITAG